MAHVSLRKIVLASAVAGVIALMSLGTVGCAPKTADLSETGSGSQAEADENAAMTGDFAFSRRCRLHHLPQHRGRLARRRDDARI